MKQLVKYIPNMITCFSIFFSFGCVIFLIHGGEENTNFYFRLTIFALVLSAIFDFLDGKIARYLNVQSNTGRMLDALHDVIVFGVVVALFYGYALLDDVAPFWVALVLSFHVCACTLRLARYVSSDEKKKDQKKEREEEWFSGLPTPYVSLLLILLCSFPLIGIPLSNFWVLILPVIFGILMILPLPCPSIENFKDILPNMFCVYAMGWGIFLGVLIYLIGGQAPYVQVILFGAFAILYFISFVTHSMIWIFLKKKRPNYK